MIASGETLSLSELKKRLEPVLEDRSLQLALLFGSAASGKTHGKSDVDLAFLFDTPIEMLSFTNELIRLLHTDNIDIIDLRRTSPLLKMAAVTEGILLREREEGVFNSFYSLVFRMYGDTRKLREAQREAIRLFLEKRGLS